MESSTFSETSNRKKAIGIVAWYLTVLVSFFPDALYLRTHGECPYLARLGESEACSGLYCALSTVERNPRPSELCAGVRSIVLIV